MVLISAVGFGSLGIFAKFAYIAGLGTEQTLAFRFVLAAAGVWVLALALGQNPVRLKRNELAMLVALGAVIYTAQALTYFIALRSLPASLVVLIAYVYPSLVVLAGWLFLRRSVSVWHGVALLATFLGVALLVGGARFEVAWGLVFAIASPMIYTLYILLGERVMSSVPAVGASAVIMTGAAVAFCILAALQHELRLPTTVQGWGVAVGIAVFPTMIAISFFLASLPRIGAARASLLSTVEPVVTLVLAAALLGDRLSPIQLAGGALVLFAVITVQGLHLWRPGPPSAIR
jgi:drug/metabolite transporter (DMT)-like permease